MPTGGSGLPGLRQTDIGVIVATSTLPLASALLNLKLITLCLALTISLVEEKSFIALARCTKKTFHYLHAYEKEQELIRCRHPRPTVHIQLLPGSAGAGIHVGRTNLPTIRDDVAVLYGDHDGLPRQQHQLIIQNRASPNAEPLQIVKIVNPLLDAMLYPLLDPYSVIGWHTGIPHAIENNTRKHVTIREHAAYQMAIRDNQEYLQDSGKLSQQWLDNQSALRRDTLQNIGDFNNPACRNVLSDDQPVATNPETSLPVLLPSTFIGGPRHAMNTMHDMLAMSMQLGAATFFVTVTANPAWPEIEASLNPGNKRDLRPDIGNRVFHCKQNHFKDLVTKEAFFGNIRYSGYSVEMQKRQIPHSHWIIAVEQPHNSRDPEYIDLIICTEIPDPEVDPELYEIVCNNYLHLCTEICSPGGGFTCKTNFPKAFQNHTQVQLNGYPLYRWRDNGRHVMKRRGQIPVRLDNRHVVPYNPYLAKMFGCHINVEHLSAIRVIKYIFNYINKSHDVAHIAEIISSEAANEIRRFQRLTVHTKNDLMVYFADGQAGPAAQMAANHRQKPEPPVFVKRVELAASSKCHRQTQNWLPLASCFTMSRALASGRSSSLSSGTAFEETLDEVAQCQHPRAFRILFGQLLALTRPSNGGLMWECHKEELTHHRIRVYSTDDNLRFAHGLRDIRLIAEASMVDWTNLNFPEPPVSAFGQLRPFDKYVIPNEENVGRLNAGQLSAYNAIIATFNPSYAGPTCFFLDGLGGTGKTFLYKALIQYFRNNGHVVVPSAWTGIAALLLPGGHTSHFFFKFPVPLMEDSNCGLCRASVGGRRLIDAKLIIMDEASICEWRALMAMDRILRDLTEVRHRPFGGKILLLGGDFRQCAPVIPNAPAGSNNAESIRSSNLWSEFKLLQLTQNMRVGPGEQDFTEYLLTIGSGSVNVPDTEIMSIPDDILFHGSPQDLIHWVYENNLAQPNPNHALLCPRNDHCDYIYNLILDSLEGDQRVYFSEDKLINPSAEAIADYPPELLNHVEVAGLPPHQLRLRVDATVILILNMLPVDGLGRETMIPELQPASARLLQFFLCRFLKPALIKHLDLVRQMDFSCQSNQVPLNEVELGTECELHLEEALQNGVIETDIINFCENCLRFYVTVDHLQLLVLRSLVNKMPSYDSHPVERACTLFWLQTGNCLGGIGNEGWKKTIKHRPCIGQLQRLSNIT
uniref:uncharacterized protein LOC117611166 n=2 Tax=Osmia lignaria TaxID=473952 RepID=UPI0014794865|nr:uncharacterized protein LOC117611166 [Osmia lignaria]